MSRRRSGQARARRACRARRRPDARAPGRAPGSAGRAGRPRARRAASRKSPWARPSRVVLRATRLEAGQERLNVGRVLHGAVRTERNLRRDTEVEVFPQPVPDEATGALERLEGLRPLVLGT